MPELNFDFFLFIVTDTCSTHSIARDLGLIFFRIIVGYSMSCK